MAAALEKNPSIIVLQIPSEWEKNNNNILCLFLHKVGLVIKFYKSLSQ